MSVIRVEDLDDPRLALYRDLKGRELRERSDAFIVEGRGPLETLLDASPFRPESLLLSERALRSLADRVASLPDATPVYVASRSLLEGIVGFDLHRGVLALARREPVPGWAELFGPGGPALGAASPTLVLEAIANLDNMGALFRNARAFGVPAIALCPRSCDPLYRKAIRTSMGATLCVPFARADDWPAPLARLRARGFTLAALHPGDGALPLAECERSVATDPIALLLGTEGSGLSDEALAECDLRLRIPMAAGMDSINVATAGAIALHHFAERSIRGSAERGPV